MFLRNFIIFVFSLLVASHANNAEPLELRQMVEEFFKIFYSLVKPHKTMDDFNQLKSEFIKYKESSPGYDPDAEPYFKIFPKYVTTLEMGQFYSLPDTCFENANVRATKGLGGEVLVNVHLGGPSNSLCHVGVIVATNSQLFVEELRVGDHWKTFRAPKTDAEIWDLHERGPRVFLYPISPESVASNLAATAVLFEPVATKEVSDFFAKLNVGFLSKFAGIEMEERSVSGVLEIPESEIHSGDTFDIMRLDGLDPMIAWAMGAATGHTAVAMWRNDSLMVCESNAVSAYWPINGVQCNPYKDWIGYASENGYNFVWAPLKPEISSGLDMDAAWEFIDSMVGVDYGYEVVLMGLLDTYTDNLPCAGANRTMCLEPQHFEMLFSYVERISAIASRVFKPAMMQRAGVGFDQPILEAYYAAHLKGIEPDRLYLIPEEDGWLYETTRFEEPAVSPVAICNVFVCNVWKAGGVFSDIGNDIKCGETSVNDNYKLNIYKEDARLSVCTEADPQNPLCQIGGSYSLRLDSQPGVLPRYNYVDLQPGILENCPSMAPDYLAPRDC